MNRKIDIEHYNNLIYGSDYESDSYSDYSDEYLGEYDGEYYDGEEEEQLGEENDKEVLESLSSTEANIDDNNDDDDEEEEEEEEENPLHGPTGISIEDLLQVKEKKKERKKNKRSKKTISALRKAQKKNKNMEITQKVERITELSYQQEEALKEKKQRMEALKKKIVKSKAFMKFQNEIKESLKIGADTFDGSEFLPSFFKSQEDVDELDDEEILRIVNSHRIPEPIKFKNPEVYKRVNLDRTQAAVVYNPPWVFIQGGLSSKDEVLSDLLGFNTETEALYNFTFHFNRFKKNYKFQEYNHAGLALKDKVIFISPKQAMILRHPNQLYRSVEIKHVPSVSASKFHDVRHYSKCAIKYGEYKNSVFFFGGELVNTGRLTNQLFKVTYNEEFSRYYKDSFFKVVLSTVLEEDLIKPCPRKDAAMCSTSSGIFLYGGVAQNGNVLNDLYVVSLSSHPVKLTNWKSIRLSSIPPPLYGTLMIPTADQRGFHLLGGFDATKKPQKIQMKFDLFTKKLIIIKPNGPSMPIDCVNTPIAFASGCLVGSQKFAVVGGVTTNYKPHNKFLYYRNVNDYGGSLQLCWYLKAVFIKLNYTFPLSSDVLKEFDMDYKLYEDTRKNRRHWRQTRDSSTLSYWMSLKCKRKKQNYSTIYSLFSKIGNDECGDIDIVTSDPKVVLQAHQCILASRSPYLKEYILKVKKDQIVPLSDEDRLLYGYEYRYAPLERLELNFEKYHPVVVRTVLGFLYSNEFRYPAEHQEAILEFSRLLGVSSLFEIRQHDFTVLEKANITEMYLKDIQGLFKNETFADCAVDINGHLIPAHRILLSRVPHFRKSFHSNMVEEELGILRFSEEDSMENVLTYLYTDVLTLTPECAIDLLLFSLFLNLEEIAKFCRPYVKRFINVENVLDLAPFFEEHQEKYLVSIAVSLISHHYDTLSLDPRFANLSSDIKNQVLSSYDRHLKRQRRKLRRAIKL